MIRKSIYTGQLQGQFGADLDVIQAAKNLLADSVHTRANVLSFQQAWNAAGKTPALTEDGLWGPNTANALANYGQVKQGQEVPRARTTITAQDMANALATVWPVIVGGTAPQAGIVVLLAQSAFETLHWVDCWNYNLGNIKHNPGDGNDWFTMTATEVNSDGETIMVPSLWRAYPSLQEGAKAYLAYMMRLSSSWRAVLAGDADAFVSALKAENYFTGDLAQYTAGVGAYWDKFQDILPSVQTLQQVGGHAKSALKTLFWALAGTYAATKAYEHRHAITGYAKEKLSILAPGGPSQEKDPTEKA